MNSIKEIKLKRMEFGYRKVLEVKDKQYKSKFRSHIGNIPMYINANGLVPALAFVGTKQNKDKSLEQESYRYIADLLIEYFTEFELVERPIEGLDGLVGKILAKNMTEYRRCSLEVISMLELMVKFAEGMIEKDQGDEANGK